MNFDEAIFYKDFQHLWAQAFQKARQCLHVTQAIEMSFSVSLMTLSSHYNLKGSEMELRVVREALMKMLDPGNIPDFDDWVVGLEVAKENYLRQVYFQGVTLLWTILEVFVRDLVSLILEFDRTTFASEEFKKIRVSLLDYHRMTKDQQIDHTANLLLNATYCNRFLGAERFDCILRHVGLAGATGKRLHKKIAEVQQIRNSFIHNNAVADRKFIDSCPWLGYREGENIRISFEDFLKLHKYVLDYIFEVARRFDQRYPDAKVIAP
ncbi:MAG: hypothetical protein KIT46_06840 [Anaerolineales bacterium]|nr:hypothetical protein [Anaerolineales bacterium]MCW5855744.1 hypothetical protein [Anaerolineales bacterium]